MSKLVYCDFWGSTIGVLKLQYARDHPQNFWFSRPESSPDFLFLTDAAAGGLVIAAWEALPYFHHTDTIYYCFPAYSTPHAPLLQGFCVYCFPRYSWTFFLISGHSLYVIFPFTWFLMTTLSTPSPTCHIHIHMHTFTHTRSHIHTPYQIPFLMFSSIGFITTWHICFLCLLSNSCPHQNKDSWGQGFSFIPVSQRNEQCLAHSKHSNSSWCFNWRPAGTITLLSSDHEP